MSEFGSGIVVCLAKFSEHLKDNYGGELIQLKKGKLKYENLSPMGKVKYDVMVKQPRGPKLYPDAEPIDEAISSAIEIQMNAASDHFYDLDREKAPKPLVELADLTLAMGHGFTQNLWTEDDYKKVWNLWRESCLAVDKMLGVKGDWGEW